MNRWPFSEVIRPFKGNVILLILVVLVLAGCGRGGCSVSSSSSSAYTINVNGRTTSHKTLTRTLNGVTRRLDTTTDVEIQNGQVTKFPTAALVQLQETGGPGQREAELRENAGKLELWVKDKGNFRRGSAAEEKWLEGFLRDITTK